MDLTRLSDAILAVPLKDGRRIIAIVGAPASGKSTLAAELERLIDNACVLPMDGFHRDNEDLRAHGLLERKGAPETFDVLGFEHILRAVRTKPTLGFPTFDRDLDRSVPNGGQLHASDETILVEGNYLLLNSAPWDRITAFWDLSIMLDVSQATLEERLVQRWRMHGHSDAQALERARRNDLPNALFMKEHSVPADLIMRENV